MPHKALKTLFVETVLFISLFALVGHLSINFWERYIIQTELYKMKSSLHSLKDTIHHIDVAYNQLHRELQDLAEIAEKGNRDNLAIVPVYQYQNEQQKTTEAQQLLEDIQIQAIIGTSQNKVIPKNKIIQTSENKDTQMGKNSTATLNFLTLCKDDPKDTRKNDMHEARQHDHMHLKTLKNCGKEKKNVATITVNPPKSIAINTGHEVPEILTPYTFKSRRRNNIHRCQEQEHFCSSAKSDDYDFSRY